MPCGRSTRPKIRCQSRERAPPVRVDRSRFGVSNSDMEGPVGASSGSRSTGVSAGEASRTPRGRSCALRRAETSARSSRSPTHADSRNIPRSSWLSSSASSKSSSTLCRRSTSRRSRPPITAAPLRVEAVVASFARPVASSGSVASAGTPRCVRTSYRNWRHAGSCSSSR